MNQPDLFTTPDLHEGRHRHPDWKTSIAGARDVQYRVGTQKARLLASFREAWPEGLTDEEAATRAGISLTSEYSKRCGELRQDGYIDVLYEDKEPVTRRGAAGIDRIVSIALETRRPRPDTATLTTRASNPKEVRMLTEEQAQALINGQPRLVNLIASKLGGDDRHAQAEWVLETVADWLSGYRPEELGDMYGTPLDVTAFILRKGQVKE